MVTKLHFIVAWFHNGPPGEVDLMLFEIQKLTLSKFLSHAYDQLD